MEKQKILISINTSWNIFNFRRNLLSHLADSGFEIHAAAPFDAYSEKLEKLGLFFYDLPMEKKGTNPMADYRLFVAYRKLINDIRPGICLFYTIKPNIYGTLAAARAGIPVVNNISGLGTVFLRKGLSSTIAKALYKLALKKSSHTFFQNEEDRQLFIDQGLIERSKTSVIPGSGIDTDYFIPGESAKKDATFRFLMVSRLIFDKGIMEYLSAAEKVGKKYPNARFEILGRPEQEANLGLSKEQIETYVNKGIVEWTDEQEDIREILSQADVIVLPSYREGLSRALLEACSMAKPIIATDVAGCRELVDQGKNGFLCRPKDSDSLAEVLERAIGLKQEERLQMGQYGRNLVKSSYDQKLIFKAYQNAIANILK